MVLSISSCGLAWLLLAICAQGDDAPPNLRPLEQVVEQVLVFDAGSSGTRIHVFNMYAPASGAHVPSIDLAVRDAQTLRVKPGLSHFAETEDLEGCRWNFEKLIAFANQFVPVDRRSSTPALLKATAGLRAVDSYKADAVLNTCVRATLRQSEFKFQDDWADIIKGKEEAGLAWMAANYLRGTFAENAVPGTQSLGVIEMGGGSTQVSFEVSSSDRVVENDDFQFTTAMGKQYQLYAHSYLGFGQDYAQAQLRQALGGESVDPCYPVGYFRKSKGRPAFVNGTGDVKGCLGKIQSLLLQSSDQAPGRYPHELPVRGPFAATENFFYVRKELSLTLKDELRPSDTEASDACSKAMVAVPAEISSMEEGSADAGRPTQCFALSYQNALLQALKIPTTPGVKVQVMRKINGGDVDWALGAALVHFLQSRANGNGLGVVRIISFIAAALVLVLAGKAIFVAQKSGKKSPRATKGDSPTIFGQKNAALE